MINSIEYTRNVRTVQKLTGGNNKMRSAEQKQTIGTDEFESNKPKINLKKALKDGSLSYTEPTKLFGITLREGFYTYQPQKNERISDIKRKFGIKEGIIGDMNGIRNDNFCPAKNGIKEIYFRLGE